MVVAVHNEHTGAGGDGGADGGAQHIPLHAQGDAQRRIAQRDNEVHQRAELVHIFGSKNLIAQHLDVGP